MVMRFAAGALVLGIFGAGAAFAQDCTPEQISDGEGVFRKCAACHQVGEGAENKVGPVLTGVVGRPVASVEGFNYSDAMTGFGAEHPDGWTVEMLDAYLTKPRDVVSGTRMAFAGLRKEDERAEVICYLSAN